MKKSTTITYNIESDGGVSTNELEYKDYVKNEKGEENLLHYKVKNVTNDVNVNNGVNITRGDEIKAISVMGEIMDINELNETFNKIYKLDNKIDETIGISKNNDDWKIKEYKNHILDKEYKQEYNDIKFDINYDLLQKCKN